MQPDLGGEERRPVNPPWRVGQTVRLRDHAPGVLAGRQGVVVLHLAGVPLRAGRWIVHLLADPWAEPATVEMFGDELASVCVDDAPLMPRPATRQTPLA